MDVTLKFTENHMSGTEDSSTPLMSIGNVRDAYEFHKSFPEDSVTPLHRLDHMARYLGIDRLYVKDESYRFGLNAFKVLGSTFAAARYIGEQTGRDISELPYEVLCSEELRRDFGQTTFFTATDGNHGRGVAWAAHRLGQRAVVFMPKGTTAARKEHIQQLGARVTIENMNYDACVRKAAQQAAEAENGVLMQDTAWEGYSRIPSWIMQGYGTLALEADRQMQADSCDCPTHIFIQAGVGSLAGAVVGYFAQKYRENPPIMVVAEANAADCMYHSACRGDGELCTVGGDLETIMAGLACGEANPAAWDILRNHAAAFASCPDWMSTRGTRMYAAPLGDDPHIISGESGSVTLGLLSCIMTRTSCRDIRDALHLDEHAQVLLVSTEGNTDPVRYHEIIWDGLYGLEQPRIAGDFRMPE